MNNKDIVSITLGCIEASLMAAQETANESDLTRVARRAMIIHRDDQDKADYEIMLAAWKHIKELVEETGSGEIIREVIASEILSITPSWDKKT